MGLKIAAWILVSFVCFQLSYSTLDSDSERIVNTYGGMSIEDLLKSYKDEIDRIPKENSDANFGSKCPCLSAECMSTYEKLLSLFYRAAETPTMTQDNFFKDFHEITANKCVDCLHKAWQKKEPKECIQEYHIVFTIQTLLVRKILDGKSKSDGGKKESEDQNGVKYEYGEIDYSSTTLQEFINMYESIIFTLKKEETKDTKIYKECSCYNPECISTHEAVLSLFKRSDKDPNMSKEQYVNKLEAYANNQCIKCLHDRNANEDCLKSYDTMVRLTAMMLRKTEEA